MDADHELPATLSVPEAIRKFNGLGSITSSALMPFNVYKKTESMLSSPAMVCEELPAETESNSIDDRFFPIDLDDRGLEVIEPGIGTGETMLYARHASVIYGPSIIDTYAETDIQVQEERHSPPLPPPRIPQRRRTFPLSNFLLEIGALVVIFILCMVLVLAIRENQAELRVTMQVSVFDFTRFIRTN